MPRVLVTGATGFVGRALCPVLVRNGQHVSVATRNPRVAEQLPRVDVRPIPGIGPRVDFSAVLRDVSSVVHLAAQVPQLGEAQDEQLARTYQRINVDGARKLAQDAAAAGVRRFVYISTAQVHGQQTALDAPLREDDPARPADLYASSKWHAEQALAEVAEAAPAMDLVVLRPPLIYGPGVKGNFASLLRLSARARMLPLAGIRNRRSMIFVGNLADAILRCLAEPGPVNAAFLIRDGDDLSTPEIVRILAAGLGRTVRLVAVPTGMLGVAAGVTGRSAAFSRLTASFCLDDEKIRSELDWTPPFTVVQGLTSTAQWYAAQARRSR